MLCYDGRGEVLIHPDLVFVDGDPKLLMTRPNPGTWKEIAGHAAWTPGQLEAEMNRGWWFAASSESPLKNVRHLNDDEQAEYQAKYDAAMQTGNEFLRDLILAQPLPTGSPKIEGRKAALAMQTYCRQMWDCVLHSMV